MSKKTPVLPKQDILVFKYFHEPDCGVLQDYAIGLPRGGEPIHIGQVRRVGDEWVARYTRMNGESIVIGGQPDRTAASRTLLVCLQAMGWVV